MAIEACRIPFSVVSQILREMKSFSFDLQPRKCVPVTTKKLLSLFQGFTAPELSEKKDIVNVLYLCSLLSQALSLGFISYIQGHVGHLNLFFLDSPIERICLVGCHIMLEEYPCLELSLKKLTCTGDMLNGPVLVFSKLQLVQGVSQNLYNDTPCRSDVLASLEDIIDTWGPAVLLGQILRTRSAFAIAIRDGFLYRSDHRNNRFHWAREMDTDLTSTYKLDLATKIRIAASVMVNDNC